jgi:hypothetical protein
MQSYKPQAASYKQYRLKPYTESQKLNPTWVGFWLSALRALISVFALYSLAAYGL